MLLKSKKSKVWRMNGRTDSDLEARAREWKWNVFKYSCQCISMLKQIHEQIWRTHHFHTSILLKSWMPRKFFRSVFIFPHQFVLFPSVYTCIILRLSVCLPLSLSLSLSLFFFSFSHESILLTTQAPTLTSTPKPEFWCFRVATTDKKKQIPLINIPPRASL